MDVDDTPGVSVPVESDGTLKVISDFVLGPVRPPIAPKGIAKDIGDQSCKLIKNPKHKDDVLTTYQSDYGGDKPIVTTFQGKPPKINLKPPSQYHLVKSSKMKQHKNKSYGLLDPIFRNVLNFLVGTYLTKRETQVLASVNKLFQKVIPQISKLLKIDWRPIVEPRPKYYDQKEISIERVDMNTALALQCGLDPWQMLRTLGGEYTGEWRDVKKIVAAVKSVVSISDYMQIERILTT